MRTTLLAVGLASLVVLAGCGATTDSSSPTATATEIPSGTDTPSPTPGADSPETTPTATARPTDAPLTGVSFPEGASSHGFSNASKIAATQGEILNTTAHSLSYEIEYLSGEQAGERTWIDANDDGERLNLSITSTSEESVNTSIWVDGRTVATKSEGESGTEYGYIQGGTPFIGDLYGNFYVQIASQITSQLTQAYQWKATESFSEGGHEFVRYEATGLNQSFVEREDTANFTAGALALVLRDDGLVTEVSGTLTVESDGETEEQSLSYGVSDVGNATVEEPGWVTEEIPQVEASVVGDGTVVKLTHSGGPSIADAALSVRKGYARGGANLTSLAAGESVYVTATEGASSYVLNLSVHESMPSPGANAVDFTNTTGTTVSIQQDTLSMTLIAYQAEESETDG